MPAHTFFHAGRYHDAAVVNAQAIGADRGWLDDGGEAGFPGPASARMVQGLPPYYAHNLAFGLAGALMSGDAQLALKYADHAGRTWPDGAPVMARAYPVPRTWVALARYAPEKALAVPVITGDPRFAIYRAYARGEAMLLTGDVAGARGEVKALKQVKGAGGNAELIIARGVLEARIAHGGRQSCEGGEAVRQCGASAGDAAVGLLGPAELVVSGAAVCCGGLAEGRRFREGRSRGGQEPRRNGSTIRWRCG